MPAIVICSSVTFYETVITVKNQLLGMGFQVLVPDLALQMEHENNFSFQTYAETFDDANPLVKKNLIDAHFKKISEGDAILILNEKKHNLEGYVGPNVLMEMTVGYYLGKPIFLMNTVDQSIAAFDEIMAIQPKILNGNLNLLPTFF